MKIPDLSSEQGLDFLDSHLIENSFIVGYEPSQADITVFKALNEGSVQKYENIVRWFSNIKSFGDEAKKLPASSVHIEIEMSEKAKEKKEVSKNKCVPVLLFWWPLSFQLIIEYRTAACCMIYPVLFVQVSR